MATLTDIRKCTPWQVWRRQLEVGARAKSGCFARARSPNGALWEIRLQELGLTRKTGECSLDVPTKPHRQNPIFLHRSAMNEHGCPPRARKMGAPLAQLHS